MWRNRLAAVITIILSAVLISVRGGVISYLIFYTSCMIPLFSLVYVIYVFMRFRIYQKIHRKTIIKGERIPYEFQLSNEDIMTYTYVNVYFLKGNSDVEEVSLDKNYCLVPGESVKRDTTLCCHYRGSYLVGIHHAQVRDFFQLFAITYPIETKIKVNVLPRVVHMEHFRYEPSSADEKNMKSLLTSRPDILDIETRKYAYGDSVRQIHWKASAKNQELISRKYIEEPKIEIVLLADFKKINADEQTQLIIEDKIIESTLAIADYFYCKNTVIKILLEEEGVKYLPVHNKADFDMLYQICSDAAFRAEQTLDMLLFNSHFFVPNGGYFMLVTAALTEGLIRTCFTMVESGSHVTLLYMESGSEERSLLEMLDQRIQVVSIPFDREVIDILEGKNV